MATDDELNRDWKPNGRRPQSTIARTFSEELMNIFRIENSIADLDEQVNKRKHHVSTKASELQALEARLREMDVILKKGDPAAGEETGGTPSDAQKALEGTLDTADASRPLEPPQQPDAQKYAGSRPGTARASQQAVPGALPPTPIASEDGDGEHEA